MLDLLVASAVYFLPIIAVLMADSFLTSYRVRQIKKVRVKAKRKIP